MKVWIGYDGSDSAIEAIEQLQWAGLPVEADVAVISGADVWPPLPPGKAAASDSPMVRAAHRLAEECYEEAKTLVNEGADRVRRLFPNWRVTADPHTESPANALIAAGKPGDLIVVGTQGRSAIQRWALGSVSQTVLTHATSSVRISRRSPKTRQYANSPVRIVLGVDGSAMAAKAIEAVAHRTWPAGSEVKLVAALDPKFWAVLAETGPSPWALAYLGEAEAEGKVVAEKVLKETAKTLEAKGLKTTTHTEEGNPKHVLLDVAEQWAADCIFLGAKGHSRLERVLLGSVSTAVATRAACAVEIVR